MERCKVLGCAVALFCLLVAVVAVAPEVARAVAAWFVDRGQ